MTFVVYTLDRGTSGIHILVTGKVFFHFFNFIRSNFILRSGGSHGGVQCVARQRCFFFFNYDCSILLPSIVFHSAPLGLGGGSTLLGGLISSRRGIESCSQPFLLSAVIGVQVHCCRRHRRHRIHPAATGPPHIEQRRPPLLLSITPPPHFSAGRRTQWGTFFHTWQEKTASASL